MNERVRMATEVSEDLDLRFVSRLRLPATHPGDSDSGSAKISSGGVGVRGDKAGRPRESHFFGKYICRRRSR